MSTFNDYLKYDQNEEYERKQLIIMEKITFSDETLKKIKTIHNEIRIIAVAQVYCPDCRAIIAFMQKFAELNPNIKIKYKTKEDAKDLKYGNIERIPTLIRYTDDTDEIFLSEFPKVVKKMMEEEPEKFEDIKYNFRTGKYNTEIEKELVDYLSVL